MRWMKKRTFQRNWTANSEKDDAANIDHKLQIIA